MTEKYLDDYQPGQTFNTASYQVTEADIVSFAQEYDPQPFHTDAEQAKSSFFKGLVASGWHTAAISMRLMVTSDFTPTGGLIGAGVDELRFFQPVSADDTLTVQVEVISVRPSQSKPTQGMLRVKTKTYNQHNDLVASFYSDVVVTRKRLP